MSVTLVGAALAAPGDLTLVSTSDTGIKGNGDSGDSSLSADGTRVAFGSSATNLDPADTDSFFDVFVKDLATGDITLASTSDSGIKANGSSAFTSLSADGTRVAFSSSARNLDPADTNDFNDVYVKDLVTGDITLASISDSGIDANHHSHGPGLSADGTRVAFGSFATNLDPADTDSFTDVYIKDVATGDITLVSTSDTGIKGNGGSGGTSLSADGTRLAFGSSAFNLDPADTDSIFDVYVKDLAAGNITLASTSDTGIKGNGDSYFMVLSADGAMVAFVSEATNLDPADTDSTADVYVKDLATGDITLASTSDSGIKADGDSFIQNFNSPSLSADGTRVAFYSFATNLDPADTDSTADVYVKDLATGDITFVSISESGIKGDGESFTGSLSADGTRVAFVSFATNLDPADTDNTLDVYVKDLGPLAPSADLSVRKRDRHDPVRPGMRLVYAVKVSNLGPGQATGVTVTDKLPTSVRIVSARPNQGSCHRAGRLLTCELASLETGEHANVMIIVKARLPGLLRNIAEVTANEPDPHSGNNKDLEATRVR